MRKAAAILALVFGSFLAIAEVSRNWGDWQWWPYWLVDFISVGLLLAGGTLALRKRYEGDSVLCGAWGFTTAMFYSSFWSHIERIAEPAEGNVAHGPLTIIIGVLWVVTILGFVLSLVAGRRSAA